MSDQAPSSTPENRSAYASRRRRPAACVHRRRGGEALDARVAAHQRRDGRPSRAGATPSAVDGRAPTARARGHSRGHARPGCVSAHGARSPLRGTTAADRGARAGVERSGDRVVAGAVGTILCVPQTAARRRTGTGRRQVQAVAAGTLRRQATRAGARTCAPGHAAGAVARAARVLPPCGNARMRGARGLRQPDSQRRRHFLLFDIQPRASARARRSVRDVGEAARTRRPVARDVGAQALPVRAAARDRRAGDHRRSRQLDRRDAVCDRPAKSVASDAFRLPGQACDQRSRPTQATAVRSQSRGAAARARLRRRAMHDAAWVTSMRTGIRFRGMPREASRGASSCAPAACPPRTFALADARSSVWTRRAT